ncbi:MULTISPECIES: asparaginase [Ralstonia]|mgnify:FL=1|jgi:L-asparaginase|uniref:L-asparaginase n=3 Tax=Ralstonia TaxID=48736 RepID=A0AAD2F594_9RALS|nr:MULTISPECIES: asparaginase [Ralstonia]MEA3269255.1 asparaginase [Pseudomonadota bacterium]ENZ79840.1 L-asparaginase type II family protein [Ralstonia pickettii OR214]MBB0024230.1 asparaginase [Ralstonia pickettii]MBB0035441.1 asparaginase [Ralstonia pickettii]MBB0097558.1 asparaginase [Ralstonia pickettii]
MSLPTIAILATGGTIAGSADDAGSAARYRAGAVPIDQLLAASKLGLERLANVRAEQVAQIDSKDLTFDVWEKLVARIRHWIDVERVDGVVITHGTDTLEETAMLLHLTQQTDTPIVLTAAMRPSTSLSADGPLNLLNAVRLAASPSARGRGVLVALNQRVHAARDVQKGHTYAVEAFVSPDTGALGFVLDTQVQFQRVGQRVAAADVLPMPPAGQWPWVEVVASYAQPDARVVDALVAAGVKGLVIAATGAGSIHANLEAALNRASQQGVFVLRSTRTGAGVVPALPSADRWASSGTLNPYKARVLLTLLLASGRAQAEVASLQQVIDRY